MKAYEIIQFLEDHFPPVIGDPTDNSGAQWGNLDSDVTKVAVAYEKTLDVIHRCCERYCDMLITHRPLSIPARFGALPEPWQALFSLAIGSHNLVIYSLHANLDRGPESNVIALADKLDLTPSLYEGEYLVCKSDGITFPGFVHRVKERLHPTYCVAVGTGETGMESIGLVAGTAMDVRDILFFSRASVQCYLSGDPDDFGIRFARDLGIMTVNVDDYSLERPGILRLYETIAERFPGIQVDFIDCRY